MMRPTRELAEDRSVSGSNASAALPWATYGRWAVLTSGSLLMLLFNLFALAVDASAENVGDEPSATGSIDPAGNTGAPGSAPSAGKNASPPASGGSVANIAGDPRRIFEFALSELAAGRLQSAQRQFELFVAGHPDHPDARTARGHLAKLYQSSRGPAIDSGFSLAPPIERPRIGPSMGLGLGPGTDLGSVPPRRLLLDVKAPVRLEDSFASEAGDRVFFSSGSAELGQRARFVLQAQARWLKRNSALFAVVEGHADDEGLDSEEMVWLSQARAQAVYLRLVEEGVPRQRLATSAWGRDMPVANCKGPECAAQNRRSVTVLTLQRVSELPSVELGSGRAAAR